MPLSKELAVGSLEIQLLLPILYDLWFNWSFNFTRGCPPGFTELWLREFTFSDMEFVKLSLSNSSPLSVIPFVTASVGSDCCLCILKF